jgi:hypothetical protein
MRYILPFIIFVLGCTNNEKERGKVFHEKTTPKSEIKEHISIKKPDSVIIIKLNDFNVTFKDNLLIYPKKRVFLLFDNNSTYCKMQESVLKEMNVTYKKTNNEYLKNYFHINTYPTIIILDKNKTIRYENFIPYEILKEERF